MGGPAAIRAGGGKRARGAIAAASVVAENVVALEIARAVRQKFGGDSMDEVQAQLEAYIRLASEMDSSES